MPCMRLYSMLPLLLLVFQRSAPVASLSTYDGPVTIDGKRMPTGATVFEGQTVETAAASKALVVLLDGTRCALGVNSRLYVSAAAIKLETGAGRFTALANTRALLYASELILKPSGAATVESTVKASEVRVQVDEGEVSVLGPGGQLLRTLRKGEAHLFARAVGRSGGVAPGLGKGAATGAATGAAVGAAAGAAGGAAAGGAAAGGAAAGGAAAGAATAAGIGAGTWIAVGAVAAGATATGAAVVATRGS